MSLLPFQDLYDLSEDERIAKIGQSAMLKKQVVGFFTDDEEGKADRYIRKLTERFPGIVIHSKGPGWVEHTIFVKVGPPLQ